MTGHNRPKHGIASLAGVLSIFGCCPSGAVPDMLLFEVLGDRSIFLIAPDGPLRKADFERLADAIKPFTVSGRKLTGLMICINSFPGWESFAAFAAHLSFVASHHRRIERIAVVTDRSFLKTVPRVAGLFVLAKLKHFDAAAKDAAFAWLENRSMSLVSMANAAGSRAIIGEAIMRTMKLLLCTLALFFISDASPAQDKPASPSSGYVPSLGDMMGAIQLRHSKLFYAAKAKNWSLADYELRQLVASLKEVTRLYPGTPGSDVTHSDKLAAVIGEALKARNEARFDLAFAELTADCNACHRAAGRAFIYLRRPTFPSPFSNQVFAPRAE
jgi:hypothetical protein